MNTILEVPIPNSAADRIIAALHIDSELSNAEIKAEMEKWLKQDLKRYVLQHESRVAKSQALNATVFGEE